MNVEAYVKSIAKLGSKYHARLAELGRSFEGRVKSENDKKLAGWVKRERPKVGNCYMNAQKYVLLNDYSPVQYYEGFWAWSVSGFPLHHAWLVRDGKVIDFTAEDADRTYKTADLSKDEYFGIHVPAWFIRKQVVETKFWGILSDAYLMHLAAREAGCRRVA